jgi:hypothetical protein
MQASTVTDGNARREGHVPVSGQKAGTITWVYRVDKTRSRYRQLQLNEPRQLMPCFHQT